MYSSPPVPRALLPCALYGPCKLLAMPCRCKIKLDQYMQHCVLALEVSVSVDSPCTDDEACGGSGAPSPASVAPLDSITSSP